MVKTLGIIFGSILMSLPLVFLDVRYGNGFLMKFFKDQSIGIIATVVALNVATITFLLGHLSNIEFQTGKELFSKTRKELKDNTRLMLFLFALIFITVNIMSNNQTFNLNSFSFNPLIFIALVAFMLVFVCLYEILVSVFDSFDFYKNKK